MKKIILILSLLSACSEKRLVVPDMSTQEARNVVWDAEGVVIKRRNAAWERLCAINPEEKPGCQPSPLPGNWEE